MYAYYRQNLCKGDDDNCCHQASLFPQDPSGRVLHLLLNNLYIGLSDRMILDCSAYALNYLRKLS